MFTKVVSIVSDEVENQVAQYQIRLSPSTSPGSTAAGTTTTATTEKQILSNVPQEPFDKMIQDIKSQLEELPDTQTSPQTNLTQSVQNEGTRELKEQIDQLADLENKLRSNANNQQNSNYQDLKSQIEDLGIFEWASEQDQKQDQEPFKSRKSKVNSHDQSINAQQLSTDASPLNDKFDQNLHTDASSSSNTHILQDLNRNIQQLKDLEDVNIGGNRDQYIRIEKHKSSNIQQAENQKVSPEQKNSERASEQDFRSQLEQLANLESPSDNSTDAMIAALEKYISSDFPFQGPSTWSSTTIPSNLNLNLTPIDVLRGQYQLEQQKQISLQEQLEGRQQQDDRELGNVETRRQEKQSGGMQKKQQQYMGQLFNENYYGSGASSSGSSNFESILNLIYKS